MCVGPKTDEARNLQINDTDPSQCFSAFDHFKYKLKLNLEESSGKTNGL
jgi:hypothetical protein